MPSFVIEEEIKRRLDSGQKAWKISEEMKIPISQIHQVEREYKPESRAVDKQVEDTLHDNKPKKDEKVVEQTTKVLEATMGKPFLLKIQLTSEQAITIKKNLDWINYNPKGVRKTVVSEAKGHVYAISSTTMRNKMDNCPLTAVEMESAVDEEKRINANRLHYGKCKNYTPLTWRNICIKKLTPDFLETVNTSIKEPIKVISNEEKTKRKILKLKKPVLKVHYSNKEGICYADVFEEIPSPNLYEANGFVIVRGDTKETKYLVSFVDLNGKKLFEPYIINPKAWAEHERELQRKTSLKIKDAIESNTNADELKKIFETFNKDLSLEGSNSIKSKIKFCLTNIIEKTKSIPNYKPIFIVPFVDFPLAQSEDKDWNFIQNKKLYISKLKEVLTGMAWRNGFEVVTLSPEDSKLIDDSKGLKSLCETLLVGARLKRKTKKSNIMLRSKLGNFTKKFEKEHGRKPTKEEKEEYKTQLKVLDGSEGKPEPSNATLNGESSVPNSSSNPSLPITDYSPLEKTEEQQSKEFGGG